MPPQQAAGEQRRRSIETISIWALVGTLTVGLFAVIPSSAVPAVITKTYILAAGALITLALYILARLSRGNVILPPLTLLGALWLPAVAYGLSAAFSGASFSQSLWGITFDTDTFGFLIVVTVLGTLTTLILRRTEQYYSFLRSAAVVFGVIALLEVVLILIGRYAPNVISAGFSLLGSVDDLAYFMGLGVIAVLLSVRFLELSTRASRVLLASGVAALFLIALSNATIVWVLIALVSLGLFVEAVMQRRPKMVEGDIDDVVAMGDTSSESDESNHSLVLPLAVLAISLFFLIGGTLGSALANALHVNVVSVRPSWQSTLYVAQNTYASSPVFGSGPDTFSIQWLKYRDASLNSTVFWNSDFSSGIGFIPTSFITTGIVGALAWIALLALFLWFGLRMIILRAPEDAFTRYVSILSFVSALYLFISALFSNPNAVLLALAFVFAGLFVSTTRFAVGSQQWGIMFARSPRLGFVIVFSLTILLLASVVVAYTLVGRYIATSELASATASFSAGNLDQADKAIQNAISFAPSAAAYRVQAGIATSRLNQIANATDQPVAQAQKAFQDTLSAGINAALTSTRLSPNDYQNWLILGNLYSQAVPLNVSGAYDSAKSAYDKAQALNPTNPQIPYVIAQLDIAHRDVKAAIADLKNAISLKQDYPAAIFLLSQLEVQDGNIKDALAAALAAAYFQPNEPNILFQIGILYAAEGDLANAATALEAAVNANPQFANARYFLGAIYAKQGNLGKAATQVQAIADMSESNAKAVAAQLAQLKAGKNPFPANLLSVTPAP